MKHDAIMMSTAALLATLPLTSGAAGMDDTAFRSDAQMAMAASLSLQDASELALAQHAGELAAIGETGNRRDLVDPISAQLRASQDNAVLVAFSDVVSDETVGNMLLPMCFSCFRYLVPGRDFAFLAPKPEQQPEGCYACAVRSRLGWIVAAKDNAWIVEGRKVQLASTVLRHCPAPTRVVLRVTDQGSTPEISVCDDGSGIPPRDRARVLDRYVRLDASRAIAGTGLGLSLVATICELHGATLSLDDNTPGPCARTAFTAAPMITYLQDREQPFQCLQEHLVRHGRGAYCGGRRFGIFPCSPRFFLSFLPWASGFT